MTTEAFLKGLFYCFTMIAIYVEVERDRKMYGKRND